MQAQKINFRRERDFGAVFGDSLKFIKQNFKPLLLCIVVIAGPFLLISAVGMSYFQTTAGGLQAYRLSGGTEFDLAAYIGSFALVMLFSFISHTVLLSTVYHYMILYYSKPFGEKISPGEVGRKVLLSFGRLFSSTLVSVIMMVIAIVIVALIFAGIVASKNVAAAILAVLMLLALLLIFMPVLSYYFTASFFVVTRDEVWLFSGMSKVGRYMKGNFWWTWLILFVAIIALYIVQIVFSLPASILSMGRMFSRLGSGPYPGVDEGPSLLLIGLYVFAALCSSLCSAFLLILSAFHFLSQEEKQEGAGLMSRIEEIK